MHQLIQCDGTRKKRNLCPGLGYRVGVVVNLETYPFPIDTVSYSVAQSQSPTVWIYVGVPQKFGGQWSSTPFFRGVVELLKHATSIPVSPCQLPSLVAIEVKQ